MIHIPYRIAPVVTGLVLAAAVSASAQSVRVDELASFLPPYQIVMGAVAQLPDGRTYGLYIGGANGAIYQVSPDGAGGYTSTVVYAFGENEPGPIWGHVINGVAGDLIEAGSDGKIYFAGESLSRFDPDTLSVTHLRPAGGVVTALVRGIDGHTLFGARYAGSLFSFDTTTGEYRDIGSTAAEVIGMQQMKDGNLITVHYDRYPEPAMIRRIDPMTGAETAAIARSRSSLLPPAKGDDGEVYVQVNDFGDRYLYRIDTSCFCASQLFMWPHQAPRITTLAGVRNGYLYVNADFNPHRVDVTVNPPALERLAIRETYNYQLLPDGMLVMFTFERAFALNTSTATGHTDNPTPLFAEPPVNDGVNGFPTEYTEAPDGMLYGISERSDTRFGSIIRIDPQTGSRAVVADVDYGAGAGNGNGTHAAKMVAAPDGRLFGSYQRYEDGSSAIFRFDPVSTSVDIVHPFPVDSSSWMPGPDGMFVNRLFIGSDGWLYGSTSYGNHDDYTSGTFFKLDPASGAFVTLARPTLANGFYPGTSMVETAPGIWFGNYYTYEPDYPDNCGYMYRLDANTGTVTTVKTFDMWVEGCSPDGFARHGDLIVAVTTWGGSATERGNYDTLGSGTLFTFDPATSSHHIVHQFWRAAGVGSPQKDVSVGADGLLYASYMTQVDSFIYEKGVVRVDPSTGVATRLAVLPVADGYLGNNTGFFVGSDGRLYGGMQRPHKTYAIAVLDGIPVAPASGPFGGTTTIAATLKAIGIPVAGRTLAFTLNGTSIGSAITGVDGVATLTGVSLDGIAVGTHPNAIGVSFAGDDRFPATSGSGSVSVVDVPTPGLVIGAGFIRGDEIKNEFTFIVQESATGINRGSFELERKTKKWRDRFAAAAFTHVWFGDHDARFAGSGNWNGQAGYRFEAVAVESTPGTRGSLRVTIYNSANQAVVTLDDELDGGTIQALRLRR